VLLFYVNMQLQMLFHKHTMIHFCRSSYIRYIRVGGSDRTCTTVRRATSHMAMATYCTILLHITYIELGTPFYNEHDLHLV